MEICVDHVVKDGQRSVEGKVASFCEECKRAGLKLTHQRLEIYREMASCRDHPTAEMIYERIRKRMPTISLDTIYRTLSNFEAHGLTFRVHTSESQAHYDADLSQHHHLVCERCGKIMDFEWKALDDAPMPETIKKWGSVSGRRITLQGVCAECLKLWK
jgi:Fur family peroxide stress response transcriptional regulator